MKNIDIIKAAQHVGDDLVSEAMDYAPVHKRVFKWQYPAAACAALLVLAAIPTALKIRSALSNSSYDDETKISYVLVNKYTTTTRTYYYVTDEPSDEYIATVQNSSRLWLSDNLQQRLNSQHDTDDSFAVRVYECSGANHNDVCKALGTLLSDLFYDDPKAPVFLNEKQIRELEQNPPEGLVMAFDLAQVASFSFEADDELLDIWQCPKMYAEIALDYNFDDAARDLGYEPDSDLGSFWNDSYPAEIDYKVEEYYDEFARSMGFSVKSLFGCLINSKNGTLSGEFDVETVRKMLGDSRVISIKASNSGGFVYGVHHGGFTGAKIVTRKQMEAIPSGLTYRDIICRLGDSGYFGNRKSASYITSNNGIFLLDFDDIDDVCGKSGAELYDEAIPLIYNGELPKGYKDGMVYGIVKKSGMLLHLDHEGRVNCGSISTDSETGLEIIREDGSPASRDDLTPGTRIFAYYEYQLESYPPQYLCQKIIILDD